MHQLWLIEQEQKEIKAWKIIKLVLENNPLSLECSTRGHWKLVELSRGVPWTDCIANSIEELAEKAQQKYFPKQ